MTISLVFFATLSELLSYNIHSIGAAAMSGGHVWRTLKPIGEAGIFLNSIHLISVCMDSTYQLQMFIYNIFFLAVFLCAPEKLFAADDVSLPFMWVVLSLPPWTKYLRASSC